MTTEEFHRLTIGTPVRINANLTYTLKRREHHGTIVRLSDTCVGATIGVQLPDGRIMEFAPHWIERSSPSTVEAAMRGFDVWLSEVLR